MSTVAFEYRSGNRAKITSEHLTMIRSRLSIYNKNARFIRKKNPFFPERMFCITKSGGFEIGLYYEIANAIKEMDMHPEISMTRDFVSKLVPQFDLPAGYELEQLNLAPYDYQVDAVKKMFSNGRGTILVGTGGGKTLIISLFLATLFKYRGIKRTLIVVPTLQLIDQTYSDMIEYGFDPGLISRWSSDHKFQNTNIIIAGVDILQSKKSDLSFLSDIELLMIDEVHILKKNNEINSLLSDINTPNRFGFTGTLPEEMQDQWNIFGKIGRVIYERSSSELRAEKYISQVHVNIIKITYNADSIAELMDAGGKKGPTYMQELEYLTLHEFRNSIVGILAKATKQNTLVMVDRIAHGELLESELRKITGKKVYFIQGSVDVEIREKIRALIEANSDVICIAISKIFSTGINIKNIHNIIFCTPGKAKVKLIQSIGRGLRLHKDKTRLTIYDIADNFQYSDKHLIQRTALYDSEKINYEIIEIVEKDGTKERKSEAYIKEFYQEDGETD